MPIAKGTLAQTLAASADGLVTLQVRACQPGLAEALKAQTFPKLDSLQLYDTSDSHAALVASIAATCPRLRKLRVVSSLGTALSPSLDGEGLPQLCAACPRLEELALRRFASHVVSDAEMDAVAKLRHLKALDLRECPGVTDEGATKVILGGPALREIWLEPAQTPSGARPIHTTAQYRRVKLHDSYERLKDQETTQKLGVVRF
jgi:hypothetical protein